MKTENEAPIRIAVVESDPLRFLGFRAIFSEADFAVRASALPTMAKDLTDDVILMTRNSGAAFYAAMSALKALRPSVAILVTGPGKSDEDILRAISAGAKGYICEDASPEEFKHAIRKLHNGSVCAPGRVLAAFIERATASPRRAWPQNDDKISDREREVLQLLIAGRSNREIAGELGIIERTVKAHIAQLMRKVGVQNRIALSVHAITHSLLSAPR